MSTCPVCGGKLGLLNRERSADGIICATCNNFFYANMNFRASAVPTTELHDCWNMLEARRKMFKETDSIYDVGALFLSIDKEHRLFYFGHRGGDKGPKMIYSFAEISKYESDAESTMITTSKGGVGRALVGAAIAGPVGAVVGAATASSETKTVHNVNETITIYFDFGFSKACIDARTYPCGTTEFLSKCLADQKTSERASSQVAGSVADELLKFKKLLDIGAITETEYNAKKDQLLGL